MIRRPIGQLVVPGVRCWQSTAAMRQVASNTGVRALKQVLTEGFQQCNDSWDIFNKLRMEIERIGESKGDIIRQWSQENDITSDLGRLLGQAAKEACKGIKELKSVPPTPFEVLQVLIEHNLARSSHFEQVMVDFLKMGQPKDVLTVWMRYLESQSIGKLRYSTSHKYLMMYAILAYLTIDPTPKLDVMLQLLKLESHQVNILPLSLTEKHFHMVKLSEQQNIKERLLLIYKQLFEERKDYFLNIFLPSIDNVKRLTNLYEKYKKSVNIIDPNVLGAFMVRISAAGDPYKANKLFSAFEDNIALTLRNSLLEANSYEYPFAPVSKKERMNRIDAIWNSYIKCDEKIDISSYKSLIRAFINSSNFSRVVEVWELDVSAEFKKDSELIQYYLQAIFMLPNKTYKDIKKHLPDNVTDIRFANAVLLKLVTSKEPLSEFEKMYSKLFDGPTSLSPDASSLAIKMYAYYLSSAKPDEFKFFDSLNIPQRKQALVAEQFVNIVSDKTATDHLLAFISGSSVFSAKNHANIITALFTREDWKSAEKVVFNFLTHSTHMKALNSTILDPMFSGFANLMIKHNDSTFIEKLKTYWLVSKKANGDVSYKSILTITNAIGTMSRRGENFGASDLEFINSFVLRELVEMKTEKNFVISKNILDKLSENKDIVIPNELLQLK